MSEDERREQVRVPVQFRAARARRWATGAWHDVAAALMDISVRGVGLSLDRAVKIGDRLSLEVPVGDSQPDLRITVEVRHVHQDGEMWRAGGLFRKVSAADHARIVQLVEGQTVE